MYKMDNPQGGRRARCLSVVLFVLAICLTMHFFVEDVLLYAPIQPGQPAGPADPIASEEVTHCDDLAMMVHLPEYFPKNPGSIVTDRIAPSVRQLNFPILTPPKAA